jgi:hypothetical protein
MCGQIGQSVENSRFANSTNWLFRSYSTFHDLRLPPSPRRRGSRRSQSRAGPITKWTKASLALRHQLRNTAGTARSSGDQRKCSAPSSRTRISQPQDIIPLYVSSAIWHYTFLFHSCDREVQLSCPEFL